MYRSELHQIFTICIDVWVELIKGRCYVNPYKYARLGKLTLGFATSKHSVLEVLTGRGR